MSSAQLSRRGAAGQSGWKQLWGSPGTDGLLFLQVQILFDNEVLPDHLTLKQLWLSRWFGKVSVMVSSLAVGW